MRKSLKPGEQCDDKLCEHCRPPARGGYESSDRRVEDMAPPPAGPAPGMKREHDA